MSDIVNIYCDESSHLPTDNQKVMGLGAVWCPRDKAHTIAERIREIKRRHKLAGNLEIKWSKVSQSKVELYQDIVDYFFDDDDLHFRALIIKDKDKLQHDAFKQDHDTWYYKMYFALLKNILMPSCGYRIYIDIKDTKSQTKERSLHDALCHSKYDFQRKIVERLQTVRSHEVEQVQLVDLLLGAVCYENKNLSGNEGKRAIIKRIKQRSGYSLRKSTLLTERKFNLFHWSPSEPTS